MTTLEISIVIFDPSPAPPPLPTLLLRHKKEQLLPGALEGLLKAGGLITCELAIFGKCFSTPTIHALSPFL